MDENAAIEQIESEIEDNYADDDLYSIKSWGSDMSFRELITMYDEDELVKPELQRHYVWDKTEASRFIDSLLLGLPVPSIFLANTKDEKKIIVDGYQRIMTVYDFINGIWREDDKIFRLSRSAKINPRWQGKAFKELTSIEQRKIRGTTIHAIIFEQSRPKNDDTSLFQVFERINTSGRALTAQEIRNCVYQGKFNKALIEMNSDEDWRALFGTDEADSRMRDIEYILRLFALLDDSIWEKEEGRISLKKYLNTFMGNSDKFSDERIEEIESEFAQVMEFINIKFGEGAFKKMLSDEDNPTAKKFHPTVYDSIAVATAIAFSNNLHLGVENLPEKKDALLNDSEYEQFITSETTRIEHIQGRINKAYQYLYGE